MVQVSRAWGSVPPPQTVLQGLVEKRDFPLRSTRMQQGDEHLWKEMCPGLLAQGGGQHVPVQHRDVTRTRSLQGFGDGRRCEFSELLSSPPAEKEPGG